MTRHPRIGSIAHSLATLSILLSPVTAAGYAFDSVSCSSDAIHYLNLQMRRAVTISANTAAALNERQIPSAITGRIGNVMDLYSPMGTIQAVFTGGQVASPNGQLQTILGIASYTQLLANFDSSVPPVDNGADAQGNVLFFCNDNRLGQASSPGMYNPFSTVDGYGTVHGGRTVQPIYFRQSYQQCQPGSVAFLVHSAQGHADRVTICDWVLEPIINHVVQGESWDTRVTINSLRSMLPEAPSDPMSPGLPIELQYLIVARNEVLTRTSVSTLPNWRSMRDIDMTVGFDSWLIYILTQTRAGGFRTGIDDNVITGLRGWPTNGWLIASANPVNGHLRSLSYMLVAQVVFNFCVGFTFGSDGSWDGFFPVGDALTGDFDFGAAPYPE